MWISVTAGMNVRLVVTHEQSSLNLALSSREVDVDCRFVVLRSAGAAVTVILCIATRSMTSPHPTVRPRDLAPHLGYLGNTPGTRIRKGTP